MEKFIKKNIYLDFGLELNIGTRLQKIKKQGYDGIFIWFYDDRKFLNNIINKANEYQLNIETMHLPYCDCNHLWLNTKTGKKFVRSVIKGVKYAHKYNIKTVVIHTVRQFTHPMYNNLGLQRLAKILRVCERLNVNLALENSRDIKYIDYVFDNIQSDKLKMCLDFGHTNCFTYQLESIEFQKYKDKIICLHIHDNDGEDDQHLIPFYGNINYEYIINELRKIGYNGPLTSEARILDERYPFTEDEFIEKVYNALTKIENMFIE